MRNWKNRFLLITVLMYLLLAGCNRRPPPPPFASAPGTRLLQTLQRVTPPRHINAYLKRLYRSFAPHQLAEVAIVETPSALAVAVDERTVLISISMLRLAQSESELAFILAHEAAHVHLRHDLARTKTRQQLELEADAKAVALLKENGFNPLDAHHLLTRMFRDYNEAGSYPSISERLFALHSQSPANQYRLSPSKGYIAFHSWLHQGV